MAKVNLGRVRTVFKGEWVAAAYVIDDVVLYAGSSYTCIAVAASANDPSDTTHWTKSAGGLEFMGAWDTSTTYKVNQIATFNGSTFIAITAHTGTQPIIGGNASWAVIAGGFKFEGAWDTSTSYHVNDVATFSGSTFIAITAHTGTQPEAAGNAAWVLFASGGDIADQSGQSGKVLSTDGTSTSWVSGNPDQSGNSGKVLKTDGTSTSWGNITVTELGVTDGTDGQVLSTNGGGIWSFVDMAGENADFGEPQTFACACRYYSSANSTCVPDTATTMMIEAWGQGGGGGGSCCCMWGEYGGQGGDYSMKKWDVSSYGHITVCGCACCCECNAPTCVGHQGQFTRYCICGTGGGSSTAALQCCYCTSGGACGINKCNWGQSSNCSCGDARAYYNGLGSGGGQGPGHRAGADCNWVCDNFCTSGGGNSCGWVKCVSTNPGGNTDGCCFYDLYVKGRCGSTPCSYTCSASNAHLLGIGGASFKGGAEQDQTCSMGNWAYCGKCGNFPGGGGHGSGACGGACCHGGRGSQGAWIVSWE